MSSRELSPSRRKFVELAALLPRALRLYCCKRRRRHR